MRLLPVIFALGISCCALFSYAEDESSLFLDADEADESLVVDESTASIFLASQNILLPAEDTKTEAEFTGLFGKSPTFTLGTDPYDSLPLTSTEKKLIYKIVTNIAKKNLMQLAFEKKSMERKGKRVNHVHPLKFLGTIFSDPQLAGYMRTIKKSSFKWNNFIEGLSGRLKEEYKRNNIKNCVPGFCRAVGADSDKVMPYINKQDWEGLVKYLL